MTVQCNYYIYYIFYRLGVSIPTDQMLTRQHCMVVITTASKDITQAFLFVDKTLICEIIQPTVIGLLILWVCTHYCFNIHSGKETINLAQVFEDCVLRNWGTNSIQTMSSKNWAKSRKVLRSSKIQTFYGRLKCHGYEIW